jgi:hypothetical protein
MSDVADDGGGGTYRVRRRRRSTVVIAVVLLALAGAFYYASSYWRASEPKAGPCSTEPATDLLQPRDVSLNVYNATSRRGLAAAVAKGADKRGFSVKAVANDPKNATVKGVAQIRFGPEGADSARLLKQYVPKATYVNDKRKGDTVDLVVGDAWQAFGPTPAAPTPTSTLPPCPTVTVTDG